MDEADAHLPARRDAVRSIEGRDEFNLVEFPLTVLTDRAPRGRKDLEWEDEIVDKATGLPVKRKVIVTGSLTYGLPTARDADVLFALVQLTKQANDFTSPDVSFSRYEMIRLLDWRDEGKSYRRLEESFNRWIGTSVYFSAWRDKESETWQSHKFHILESVSLLSSDNRKILRAQGRQELASSTFTWNKVVFRNLQAGFVCPVDLNTYFGLRSAISRRLLRYLGKHFRLRQRRDLAFDLRTFACDKVGLGRSPNVAKIKDVLQPAIEELEQIGFLEPISREERYTKIAPGRWQITLIQGPPKAEEGRGPDAGPTARPALGEHETALIARGVTPAVAARLVAGHARERIAAKLETFDWLVQKKDKRVQKSPAGYLVKSIEDDYAPPKGFESKADQASRLAAEAQMRQRTDEAKRRVEAQERARDEAEQARIRAYWEALSPEAQEALRAEALEQANSFFVRQYRRNEHDPQLARRYLKLILDTHIAGVLDGQGANGVIARPGGGAARKRASGGSQT
jgi:hypothetical protein